MVLDLLLQLSLALFGVNLLLSLSFEFHSHLTEELVDIQCLDTPGIALVLNPDGVVSMLGRFGFHLGLIYLRLIEEALDLLKGHFKVSKLVTETV